MDGEVPFEQLFPELQLTHTQGRKTIERISPDTNLFYLRLWVHTTLRDVFVIRHPFVDAFVCVGRGAKRLLDYSFK